MVNVSVSENEMRLRRLVYSVENILGTLDTLSQEDRLPSDLEAQWGMLQYDFNQAKPALEEYLSKIR